MGQVVRTSPAGNSLVAGTDEGDRLLVGGKGRGQRPEALREIESRSLFPSRVLSLAPLSSRSLSHSLVNVSPFFPFFFFFLSVSPSLSASSSRRRPAGFTPANRFNRVSRKNVAGSSSWIVDFALLAQNNRRNCSPGSSGVLEDSRGSACFFLEGDRFLEAGAARDPEERSSGDVYTSSFVSFRLPLVPLQWLHWYVFLFRSDSENGGSLGDLLLKDRRREFTSGMKRIDWGWFCALSTLLAS